MGNDNCSNVLTFLKIINDGYNNWGTIKSKSESYNITISQLIRAKRNCIKYNYVAIHNGYFVLTTAGKTKLLRWTEKNVRPKRLTSYTQQLIDIIGSYNYPVSESVIATKYEYTNLYPMLCSMCSNSGYKYLIKTDDNKYYLSEFGRKRLSNKNNNCTKVKPIKVSNDCKYIDNYKNTKQTTIDSVLQVSNDYIKSEFIPSIRMSNTTKEDVSNKVANNPKLPEIACKTNDSLLTTIKKWLSKILPI